MSEELSGTLRASSRKCVNAEFSSQMMGAAERIEELEQERDRLKGWWEVEQEKVTEAEYRLSEAVKVLDPLVQYLEDDGPILASDIEILSNAKAFLATLGEENERD